MAQAPGLSDVDTQLRAQATKDSQLMWWLHEVTDVYGPRLTGSPRPRAAPDLAVGHMGEVGLARAARRTGLRRWSDGEVGLLQCSPRSLELQSSRLAELGTRSQHYFALS